MRRREALKQAMTILRGGMLGELDQPHAEVTALALFTAIKTYRLSVERVDKVEPIDGNPGVSIQLKDGVRVTVQEEA